MISFQELSCGQISDLTSTVIPGVAGHWSVKHSLHFKKEDPITGVHTNTTVCFPKWEVALFFPLSVN